MPFVQNDKKEAFKSCFSDVRTWIQDSSKNAIILRGVVRRSRRIQVLRILKHKVDSATSGMHVLRVERQKEAFQSCFSDVKNWIQQTSQNTVILRGALRRSRRIQVLRILKHKVDSATSGMHALRAV
jgi:virulence-associated protein VapD